MFLFVCTALCTILVKSLKTSQSCSSWADRYNPMYSKSHTSLIWTCANLPSHKSYLTTQKRDNRQKGLLFLLHFLHIPDWGMHVGENTCIKSVRTGPLQTCWHTFVNTGQLRGMEHTWTAQSDTGIHTITQTPPLCFHCYFKSITPASPFQNKYPRSPITPSSPCFFPNISTC